MSEKLLSKEEKKVAVEAELIVGANPRKLAEKYGIHYTTVIGYRNAMRNNGSNPDVLTLGDADLGLVKAVADKVVSQAVKADILPKDKGRAKVDAIVDGVGGLKLLSDEFQDTITKLLHKANSYITDDMKLAEFRQVASTVGELHEKVYSKGGTQVNVQQNNGGTGFSSGMVN